MSVFHIIRKQNETNNRLVCLVLFYFNFSVISSLNCFLFVCIVLSDQFEIQLPCRDTYLLLFEYLFIPLPTPLIIYDPCDQLHVHLGGETTVSRFTIYFLEITLRS